MTQGVGLRYGPHGLRMMAVEHGDTGYRLTGLAMGAATPDIAEFLAEHVDEARDCPVAYSLGPGDFIGASFRREDGMDEADIRDQLRWEIERKLPGGIGDYNLDYAILGDVGFVFAGRKRLIGEIDIPGRTLLTDVEPVALINGCEGSDEIHAGTVMLVSVEPEGITSVVLEDARPVRIEAVPHDETGSLEILADGSHDPAGLSGGLTEKLDALVGESVERLTSLGGHDNGPTPERFVFAGLGSYAGDLVRRIHKRYGIPAAISDPFSVFSEDSSDIIGEYSRIGAAFTPCLGLALRALES